MPQEEQTEKAKTQEEGRDKELQTRRNRAVLSLRSWWVEGDTTNIKKAETDGPRKTVNTIGKKRNHKKNPRKYNIKVTQLTQNAVARGGGACVIDLAGINATLQTTETNQTNKTGIVTQHPSSVTGRLN